MKTLQISLKQNTQRKGKNKRNEEREPKSKLEVPKPKVGHEGTKE